MSTYNEGQEINVVCGKAKMIHPARIVRVLEGGEYKIKWLGFCNFKNEVITSKHIFNETKRKRTETKPFITQYRKQPAKKTTTKNRATTERGKGKRSKYPTNKGPQIGDTFLKKFHKDETKTELVDCEGTIVAGPFSEYNIHI